MGYARAGARIVSIASLLALLLLAVTWFTTRRPAPTIHVRWREGLSVESQRTLERQFALARPQHLEQRTWAYDLLDTTSRNIEALVKHPDVDDTHEIDRQAFRVRPEAPLGQVQVWFSHRLGLRFLPDLMPRFVIGLAVVYVLSTWLNFRMTRKR